MSHEVDFDRRRLIQSAALTVAATQLCGPALGCAQSNAVIALTPRSRRSGSGSVTQLLRRRPQAETLCHSDEVW
jgi:hypothetical protein